MKFSRALFSIILLILLVLAVFDLPRFTLNVGGQQLTWPALDFSLTTPGSPWGNFRKGGDLYPSNQFRFHASFTAEQQPAAAEIFTTDVNLIRRRMEAAGLYDVDMATEISDGEYQIVFTFPDYYQEVDMQRVALLLIQPGQISIWEHNPDATSTEPNAIVSQYYPGYIPKDSSLVNVGDLANISIETRTVLGGSVWRLKFNSQVKDALAVAIANAGYTGASPKPLILAIDNNPVMILISIGQDLDMLARPFDAATSNTELKVMSAYLLGDVGVRTNYTYVSTERQTPLYGLEGKTVTGIAIILSAVALALAALRQFGKRRALAFVLLLSIYILFSVAAFKLLAVTLSIGFVAGFLVMYALIAVILFDLLRTQETALKSALIKYRNLGGLLMFICGLLYVGGSGFGIYVDILGAIALMGITLYLSCVLFFPQCLAFIHRDQVK